VLAEQGTLSLSTRHCRILSIGKPINQQNNNVRPGYLVRGSSRRAGVVWRKNRNEGMSKLLKTPPVSTMKKYVVPSCRFLGLEGTVRVKSSAPYRSRDPGHGLLLWYRSPGYLRREPLERSPEISNSVWILLLWFSERGPRGSFEKFHKML
jgi:hypothetical protein